jgi:hypothetical protein
MTEGNHGGRKQYNYQVDGKEYHSESSALTGAQIKAKIVDFNPAYTLVLESGGDKPDQVITDDFTVDLNVHPPLKFYTMPPATFGRA